jgi:hypothetical protein
MMNAPDRLMHAAPWLLFVLIALTLGLAGRELVRDWRLRAGPQAARIDETLVLGLLILSLLSLGAFAITIGMIK